MKLLTLITLFLFSCSQHESTETINPMDRALAKRDFYLEEIKTVNPSLLFSARCDSLTFKALASSFGAHFDISGHEWKSGEWHRDTVKCYPDFSKSEISFDGILGVLHYIWSKQDFKMLERLNKYAGENTYSMGEGLSELTLMPQIALYITEMKGFELRGEWTGTHREHILAMSLYLRARYKGEMNAAEFKAIDYLGDAPIYKALKARFSDGDQAEVLKMLDDENIFPSTRLPLDSVYGWGSSSAWVYYLITLGILSGV